jgi:SAM-dependent methyltransferase
MSIWDELREQVHGDLEHPPNYLFDPETLEPERDLIQREKNLQKMVPEMFEGGDGFLDIGCNKGYWCVKLANKYKYIRGCDISENYIRFCQRLADGHNVPHALFMTGTFLDLAPLMHLLFDVTYVGGTHHHAYELQVQRQDWVFRPIHAWADVTKKILIVDGPWDLLDPKHNTAAALAERSKWPEDIRHFFSMDHHAATLAGAFKLRDHGPSGTGTREIAVFERIVPLPEEPKPEGPKIIT